MRRLIVLLSCFAVAFATGFLVRYAETGDPWEATRFASCAASLVIEGVGVDGVPTREAIDARLSG